MKFVELVWQYKTWDQRIIGVYEDDSEKDITTFESKSGVKHDR
jgi:hypothetical protein